MAFSELVKNLDSVRRYMRQFFAYGFRTRGDFSGSERSYDNERRRIESWLGDDMAFRRDAGGKSVFISVDSRKVCVNPLYNAFKAKSFTGGDISFHFYVLDILSDGEAKSLREIQDLIAERYLSAFPDAEPMDESTLRKKLREYEELGLVRSERRGRELLYSRTEDRVDLESWRDAVEFFTEADPLGVIGSFIEDRLGGPGEVFSFKHHYLLHAPDSELLLQLLDAAGELRRCELTFRSRRKPERDALRSVVPVRIMASTQTGRNYVLAYVPERGTFTCLRIDTVRKVRAGESFEDAELLRGRLADFEKNVWGVSVERRRGPEHLEMTVRASEDESFIPRRLERERRNGTVTRLSEDTWLYSVDCCDAAELRPWIRTFTGRIVSLKCSDPSAVRDIRTDAERMLEMYGIREGGAE